MNSETVEFLVRRIGEGRINIEGLSDEALVDIAAYLMAKGRKNAEPSDEDINERLKAWSKSKSLGLKEVRRETLANTLERRITGKSVVREKIWDGSEGVSE